MEREIVERDGLDVRKAVAICKASGLSQFQLKALESGSTSTTSDLSHLDAVRKETIGQESDNSSEIFLSVEGIIQRDVLPSQEIV